MTREKRFGAGCCRLCQSRSIDLLRKKKADAVRSLEDQAAVVLLLDAAAGVAADDAPAPEHPRLLRLAEEVQERVQRRVDERTWQVFWTVAVLGQSVREASDAAGMSYYAAFAAQKRVGRMLREEGQRLLIDRKDHPEADGEELD